MPLIPLKLPPGIANSGTAHTTSGRWRDCNFVRWHNGIMQPIGGWQRISPEPVTGRVSGLLPFRDNRLFTYLGVGTNSHLYVLTQGTLTDITPVGLAVGQDITKPGSGYGSAEYGEYTYGDERPAGATGLARPAVTWSMDTWGEFMVAMSSYDGVAYLWKPATPTTPADTVASPIPNAPTGCTGLLVTPERHLCLIGPDNDFRVVQWSDREDYTTWTASATNLAGQITLQTKGRLLRGIRMNDEVLILGETDVFQMRYVGAPLAYGIQSVGSDCGIVGANAVASTGRFVAWMGSSGFYVYNGSVEHLKCDIQDWVFREYDEFQGALVSASHNAEYGEIWWFFPTKGDQRNTRYAVWNYVSNTWTLGYLERSVYQEKGPWSRPVAAGNDGHIYEHEIDFSQGFNSRDKPWVESAPIELGKGDNIMYVTGLIPDYDAESLDALQFKFKTKLAPRANENVYGPYTPTANGYILARFAGRQTSLRVEAVTDTDWRLGVLRAEVSVGGRR